MNRWSAPLFSCLIFWASAPQVRAQSSETLEKVFAPLKSIVTLSCTITRKQIYGDYTKLALGALRFDRSKGYAYQWSMPQKFGFIGDGSLLYSIDYRDRICYKLERDRKPDVFLAQSRSSDVIGRLLHLSDASAGEFELRACIDSTMYFTHAVNEGRIRRETVRVDRNRFRIDMVERFNAAMRVVEQYSCVYPARNTVSIPLPSLIVVKESNGALMTVDSFFLGDIAVNRSVPSSVFLVPKDFVVKEF